MLCNNIKLPCLLICIIQTYRVIQRHIIAGKTSSNNRCMSCKYGSYCKILVLYIKQSGSTHPFMELSYNLMMRLHIKVHKTLNDLTRREPKKSRLYIIPLPANRIQFKVFPQLCKNLIFSSDKRGKIYKNRDRFSRNVPSSYPHSNPLIRSLFPP